jgi:hypothetical protein
VRSGHLVIITRPGIVADTDDVAVRSGHIKIKHPWRADVPEILRIEISGKVGSGHILVRPPHRNFWQWLTRQRLPYAEAR